MADYEPAYLPNGDFIFASTRCVQTVDCFWTEVSNLYTCDPGGRFIRRLGFDQVHTVYPQVLDDGRVIYTRWDYNDRGQVFPQPLFQMNPDGTGQTEFYGNNSWFPTTIAHARGIPGNLEGAGHPLRPPLEPGRQAGGDRSGARAGRKTRACNSFRPVRETPAERIDAYGQKGELFAYPFPLGEREWLVTYAPDGWERGRTAGAGDADFGIYWMDVDGRRELLVADAELPCQQAGRRGRQDRRHRRGRAPSTTARIYRHLLRAGYLSGTGARRGSTAGTIKKMRVVALDFRPAGIRSNGSGGPGGGALISTPVAIGNGTWDVKRVLGETPVHEDGSAFFIVPARTPVYFQALDDHGPRGADDAQLEHPATRRERVLRRLPRVRKTARPPRTADTAHPGAETAAAQARALPRSAARLQLRPRDPADPRPPLRPLSQPPRPGAGHAPRGEGPPFSNKHRSSAASGREQAFSLSRRNRARRNTPARDWSDAYLVLTQASRDGGKATTARSAAKPTADRRMDQLAVRPHPASTQDRRLHHRAGCSICWKTATTMSA